MTGNEARFVGDGVHNFGPISVSVDGAQRVRGHRPHNASLYTNYRHPSRWIDAELRGSLALFERTELGRSVGAWDSRQPQPLPDVTGVESPPPKWAALELPDLPIRWTPKLIRYVEYLTTERRGIALMRGWLQRLARYEHTLRQILARAGVPTDLVFLALAESSFDPRARSRVGAAGLWQFMKPTGVVYGLESKYWVDDRFDIIKSTYAAAAYLDDLHTRFGSWELAMAAYNAGYGLVAESMRRNNTNDFWALSAIENGLPYATTNYTPKILAAAVIAHNREHFGFSTQKIEAFDKVTPVPVQIDGGLRLDKLAKTLDVDEALLSELNAHFVRGRTPPRRKSTAYIPKSRISAFEAAHARALSDVEKYDVHRVVLGDDLEGIAGRFGTNERLLRRINRVYDSGELVAGVPLLVPTQTGTRKPDVAFPLAALPTIDIPSGHKLVFFRMTRAATGRDVAEAFGCLYSELVAWNKLDPHARLQSGQTLQVVVNDDFSPAQHGVRVFDRDEIQLVTRGSLAHLEAALAERDLVRRGYRARRGTTLARIGKRFGLTVGSLARINGFSRHHELRPGEVITVYVPKNKTGGTIAAPPPRGLEHESPSEAAMEVNEPSTADTAKLPGRRRRGDDT